MSGLSKLVGLALAALLLASCGQAKGSDDDRLAAVAATPGVATPTLLPGLPTSTPWAANSAALASPAPTATPTASPTPTATPRPVQRLALGESLLQNEDFAAAAEQYQAGLLSDELSEDQRQAALLGLGQARLAEGQYGAADEAFGTLLADAGSRAGNEDEHALGLGDQGPEEARAAEAYYLQAQSYEAQNNCAAAIGAYETYLRLEDALTAYVAPRIGECQLALGRSDEAIAVYEAAVAAEALPAVMVANRYRLAALYQEEGDFEAAKAQYEAVLAAAETESVLGQATYLAGTADLLAGNTEAAYARYLEGVTQYPKAYESYLALVALIDAGYEIDDLQRGIIDYHAKAYEAAVTALSRYLETTEPHDEEAHLYLAWSLERLGNVPPALEQLEIYVATNMPDESQEATPSPETNTTTRPGESPTSTPEAIDQPAPKINEAAAKGTLELAKMLARAGQLAESAERYSEYVTLYPEGPDGPFAAWWSAAFAERLDRPQEAIERYQLLAELYPEHEDADEALFRAGYLAYGLGDLEAALELWAEAARRYTSDEFGAASLIWLHRISQEGEQQAWLELAAEVEGATYYPLRLQHILSDTAPFQAPEAVMLSPSARDQAQAESWLREALELPSTSDVATLSEALIGDGRLLRGQALWLLGQRQEAKAELESLRREYADDALASYQLALFLRDLGLYRSSILASVAVMNELEVDPFKAPRFIAGLAYPTYYADLITAEAERYGYDPLLQFSLVRQESLFESFATSGAAAQGLSQVIPDTGSYIAQRLRWPDYVNEDLYRPYVGIAFGAFYLDQQLRAFDGDVAAALSAYNGGPGNAARWYEQAGGDIDLYVETVDFSETRQYIERIYAGQAIYRHLYGLPAP